MNRNEAHELLTTHTKGRGLLNHAYAVEAAMRAYAGKFDEDVEKWGVVGLLHDFDYEQHPDDHPAFGVQLLAEKNVADDIVHAIKSHADYMDVERVSLMDKTLYAVDELCGFLTAVALVRPSKSIHDVKVKSVKKKMKDKGFARAVNREEMIKGAAELGVPLEEHIAFVIDALRGIADELGLAGSSDA